MATRTKTIIPKRGEVYIVNFDPTVGAEIQKTRPALILQNDIANRYSSITIVAALTSQRGERLYPTEVLIQRPEGGLEYDSVVLLNQIRTIDKVHLIHARRRKQNLLNLFFERRNIFCYSRKW